MTDETAEPTLDEWGRLHHPAQGAITIARVTGSTTLFGSDIEHQHVIRLTVSTADRKDDLHTDWINPHKEIVEVDMSLAQFGQMISSQGLGSGTPCTIRAVTRLDENDEPSSLYKPPGLPHRARSAENVEGLRDVVTELLAEVSDAIDALDEAISSKAPAAQRREALHRLKIARDNAAANAEFAQTQAHRAAENLITQTASEIEARILDFDRLMTLRHTADVQRAIESAQATTPALETGDTIEED